MEKLLAIISIGQRVYGRWLFQRLLPSIMVIVGLTIVISIMISAMLVGCFYAGYQGLLNYGFEANIAILIIFISSLLTIILLVVLAIFGLRHLNKIPQTAITQSPLTTCAKQALGSFLAGFMAG